MANVPGSNRPSSEPRRSTPVSTLPLPPVRPPRWPARRRRMRSRGDGPIVARFRARRGGRLGRTTVATLLLAAIALPGGPAPARAESTIGLNAGFSAPTGDLGRAVGNGFHVGLSFVRPMSSRDAIGIDANYHVLSERTQTERIFGFPITLEERADILEAVAYVRVILAPEGTRVAPYLRGGFGLDYVDPTVKVTVEGPIEIHGGEAHLWPGLLGGAGMSIPVGEANGLRIEGLFHQIMGNDPANLFTVGLTWWWSVSR